MPCCLAFVAFPNLQSAELCLMVLAACALSQWVFYSNMHGHCRKAFFRLRLFYNSIFELVNVPLSRYHLFCGQGRK